MRAAPLIAASSLLAWTLGAVGAAPALARPGREAPSTATAPAEPGAYVSISPFRAGIVTLAAGQNKPVTVAGTGKQIPATAAAVAITLTSIAPTASGALVVFPDGGRRPATRNLSFQKAQSVAVATVSRISSAGVLDVENLATSGQTQVAVDVTGYYAGGTVDTTEPGMLNALPAPQRSVDTRSSTPLRADTPRSFAIGHGVPTSGVGAVAIAITVLSPAKTGTLTAWAYGNDQPVPATVRFTAGQSSTGYSLVPTNAAGQINVYNGSAGTIQVLIDVIGWTNAGVTQDPGAFQPRFPARILPNSPVAADGTATVPVLGKGGVPMANVPAVVLSISVTTPTRSGGLVAWGNGSTPPSTTNLQFAAGGSTSNLALVRVASSGGTITIRNRSAGTLRLWVDVVGFVPSDTLNPPVTSIGRYVRNITGTDYSVLGTEGCADAKTASTLILLEVGAQTITDLPSPGVRLTQIDTRLTNTQLESAIRRYESGFSRCAGGRGATIAVGTSNGGAYPPDENGYGAAQRGTDWANLVADLRGNAPTDLKVVGANDIEAGFDESTDAEQHASDWEDAYLGVQRDVGTLIFNGSLDGCPDAFGATLQSCADGWTQAEYYNLAYGKNPNRIEALPQVYTISQATQWTNVVASGFNGMAFAGVLTEHAADPTGSLTPANGWAALVRGPQTLSVDPPVIPAVTDLQVDS